MILSFSFSISFSFSFNKSESIKYKEGIYELTPILLFLFNLSSSPNIFIFNDFPIELIAEETDDKAFCVFICLFEEMPKKLSMVCFDKAKLI